MPLPVMNVRRWIVAVALPMLAGYSYAAALPASEKLSAGEIPGECRAVAGVHTAGPKAAMLFDYGRYASVLPPVAAKGAQSLDCDGQLGSLLFFEYNSPQDRDQAELFAKPVISHEEGAAASEMRETPLGFIVISFKQPPAELLAALDRKLSGESPMAAAPVSPVAAPNPLTVAVTPPVPAQIPTPPPVAPVEKPAVENVPPALVKPVPMATTAPASVVQTKPISAFAPPPPLPRPAEPAPPVPLATVPPPISGTISEIDPAVVSAYASKMNCEGEGNNPQIVAVCKLLKEFTNGTRPATPLQPGFLRLGPIYTIDSYGRLVDLHYDALIGTTNPRVVAFFSIISGGGQEDFELQQLMDARKTGKELPGNNSVLTKIRQLYYRKRFSLALSTGVSLALKPGGLRVVYVRQAGNHLIIAGPSGKTLDEQTRSSFVIAPLY